MKCTLCKGERSLAIGSLSFKSKPLGSIIVPNIKHYYCSNCGDINIDYNESLKVHDFIKNREKEALLSLPIRDFVTQNQAAKILEITKQAFSKHSRIKRGFIYFIIKDKTKLFYKPSVEAFKINGKDGRINIAKRIIVEDIPQIYQPIVSTRKFLFYSLSNWADSFSEPSFIKPSRHRDLIIMTDNWYEQYKNLGDTIWKIKKALPCR